jgi:hypothetical protein
MPISKTLAEAFEGFWAAWVSRPENPKAAARLVFERRVREGVDATAIVAAAGRYAAFCAKTKKDGPFIPHARTWLSQRRYEDYFEDASASAAAARPTPEHPLAWLKPKIGNAAWASWIAQLAVETRDETTTITARTTIALDHVRSEWGYLIRAHYGPGVAWALQQKD